MIEKDFKDWLYHFEWRYIFHHYRPCKLLDFGCGNGYGDIYLARSGFEVWGYDPDPERLNIAKYLYDKESPKVKSRLHFSNALPDTAIDLTWICHVLEHCPKSEWSEIFDKLNTYHCPIFVSTPQGRNYDMSDHVNHWELPDDLKMWLNYHSQREWEVWDAHHLGLLRAKTL